MVGIGLDKRARLFGGACLVSVLVHLLILILITDLNYKVPPDHFSLSPPTLLFDLTRPSANPDTRISSRNQSIEETAAASRLESYTPETAASDFPYGDAVVDRQILYTDSVSVPRMKPSHPQIAQARLSMTPQQQRDVLSCIRNLHIKRYRTGLKDSAVSKTINGQWFHVQAVDEIKHSPTDLDEVVYRVNSRGEGYDLSSAVRVRRSAFSQFAHYVDFWNPSVAVHDDVIVGRFHTNSPFSVSDMYGVMPVFKGRVTTTAGSVETRSDAQEPYETFFPDGVVTKVDEIPILRKLSVPSLQEQKHVFRVSGEAWITFSGEGLYSVIHDSGEESKREILSGASHFIVADGRQPLHLKGVVRGQVSVYSEGDIIIDGDLRYARHPSHSPNSPDFLGIVSMKDVEIANRKVTGPGDLTIHAAIYAGRQFRIPDYYREEYALLHVYGSLSAGSMSPTEPRFGTRVVFDKRFETRRPPDFPMTDQFEIVDWDRLWTVESSRVVETADLFDLED